MQDPPVGVGGVVEDGTYWLTLEFFVGAGQPFVDLGGAAVGGTVVIAGGKIHQAITAQPPPETNGTSGTFVTAGNKFTMALTCGMNPGTTTGSYTVSGKTVTLYAGSVGLVLDKQ